MNHAFLRKVKFKVINTFNPFIPKQGFCDPALQFGAYIGNRFTVQIKRFNPVIPAIHDILIAFCLKDFENRLFHSVKPICMGLNHTLNRCLQKADGEYVARMDGDDVSLPTRLEKEATFLDEHPEYAIVSTPMIFFDESGDWGRSYAIEKPTKHDFIKHSPVHCHAPCMIRREAYLAVGGYTEDKRMLRFEDVNLWYKLYAKGYVGYNLDEPLYKMRDDPRSRKPAQSEIAHEWRICDLCGI